MVTTSFRKATHQQEYIIESPWRRRHRPSILHPAMILRRPLPPQGYFVGSAVFHYLGPAFAVLLFAHVGVLGVAWLRIATAAAVFAVWRRPWRWYAGLARPERRTVLA